MSIIDSTVKMRSVLMCALLLGILAGPAAANDYAAERFDSRIEARRGGTLRVTETVRLRFASGTFTHFYREIPTRLTDGIEIVSAYRSGSRLWSDFQVVA